MLPKDPNWFNIIAREMGDNMSIIVGLVNMDNETLFHIHRENIKIVNVHFNRVHESMQWLDLYPEWINENGQQDCPHLPMPRLEEYSNLDVVIARLPDVNGENELRNVFRLQVNLVVANLLVRSGIGRMNNISNKLVFAVFIESKEPTLA